MSGTGTPVFRIEGDRVSIVTDPYTPEVAGLDPVEWPVNVVIMSSATDRFHSTASCSELGPAHYEQLVPTQFGE